MKTRTYETYNGQTGTDPQGWAGRHSDSSFPVQLFPSSSLQNLSVASCRRRRRHFCPTNRFHLRHSKTLWEELRALLPPCREEQPHLSVTWRVEAGHSVGVLSVEDRGSDDDCCYDDWASYYLVSYFEGSDSSSSSPSSTDSTFCNVGPPSATTSATVPSDPAPNSSDWPSKASARLSQPVRGDNSSMQRKWWRETHAKMLASLGNVHANVNRQWTLTTTWLINMPTWTKHRKL